MNLSYPARILAVTAAALLAAGCSSSSDTTDAPSTPTESAAPQRAGSPVDWNIPAAQRYHRQATYPVYLNRPQAEPIFFTSEGNRPQRGRRRTADAQPCERHDQIGVRRRDTGVELEVG